LWSIEPLLGNDRETTRQQPLLGSGQRGWEVVFSAGSAKKAAHATMNKTMRNDVFYAIRAEEL
jgi:hypothetical protein